MGLLNSFDRHAQRMIAVSLVAILWFAAFAHAAHDLWAASVVYAALTAGVGLFVLARWRTPAPIKFPLALPSLLMLAAAMVSGWRGYDADAWRLDCWGWFFIFTAFYLFVNTVETPEEAERFLTIAGAAVLPVAAICGWQQLTGHPVGYSDFVIHRGPLSFSVRYGHWEIHGTLINANVLVGFMLYWPLLFWTKSKTDKRYGIFYAACILILLLARSWSGALALLLGHLVASREWLRQTARRRPRLIALLFGGVLALIAAVVWIKFHQPMWKRYYASSDRWYFWLTALNAWRHAPLTGVGVGGYPMAFSFFRIGAIENTRFAHSFILGWLAETGAVGLAALIFYLTAVARVLRRTSGRTSAWNDVCWGTLASVLCFSVININLEYFLNRYVLALWIAAVSLRGNSAELRPRRLWLAASGVGLFLVIPFWLNLLAASRLVQAGLYFEMRGQAPQAQGLYARAAAVDTSSADAYAGLSRLSWSAFERSRNPSDQARAVGYIREAFRRRKDFRFINQLQAYESGAAPAMAPEGP